LLRVSTIVVAGCGLALAPLAVLAQGVPVIDMSAVTAAQQNLAALQQQLQQLQSLVQTAQNLANAIGQAGNPKIIFQQALSQSGLTQFASQFNASLGNGAVPDLSSFASTQQWVTKNLTNKSTDGATAISNGRQARRRMAGEAAADGYALALSARQQIAAMATRAQTLASQVGSAGSLREDIAANTAVMLAIHDELAQIQALLAANLALQSSDQMVQTDMAPLSAATASGGSP
jgi:hypothetical protein